jgi:hypothetical protein
VSSSLRIAALQYLSSRFSDLLAHGDDFKYIPVFIWGELFLEIFLETGGRWVCCGVSEAPGGLLVSLCTSHPAVPGAQRTHETTIFWTTSAWLEICPPSAGTGWCELWVTQTVLYAMHVSAPDHSFRQEGQGRRGFYSWWVNGDADNASCGTPIKGAALSSSTFINRVRAAANHNDEGEYRQ